QNNTDTTARSGLQNATVYVGALRNSGATLVHSGSAFQGMVNSSGVCFLDHFADRPRPLVCIVVVANRHSRPDCFSRCHRSLAITGRGGPLKPGFGLSGDDASKSQTGPD